MNPIKLQKKKVSPFCHVEFADGGIFLVTPKGERIDGIRSISVSQEHDMSYPLAVVSLIIAPNEGK